MIQQRSELLALRFRPPANPGVIADRWLDAIVSNLGDFLWPWTVINLPYFSEGVNETPGITGTSGEIATAGLYAGRASLWRRALRQR